MALLAPPPRTPRLALDDNDDLNRLRMRLTQILATVVTMLVTAWLCTFGAIAALLALLVARLSRVAILVRGRGGAARRAERGGNRGRAGSVSDRSLGSLPLPARRG